MKRIKYLVLAGMLGAVGETSAGAKHFQSSYVGFDLPDNWTCKLEETEWVCEPPGDANGKVTMIAILTAKEVGSDDSPEIYVQHMESAGERPGVKVVRKPEETLIGDTIWLDATLANSEIPNYQTRYLARTEGNLGVLVTFSAHRTVAGDAQSISDQIAGSVAVISETARPELRQR